MRIGQDSFVPPATSFGAGAKSGSGSVPAFDLPMPDLATADENSGAGVRSDGQRDPIQAANDALALEFLEWAQKTPEEKIRDRILEAKGLDEESLKELPNAERDAIEDEIRAAVLRAFGLSDDIDTQHAPSKHTTTSTL